MNYEFYFQDLPHRRKVLVWAYQKRQDGLYRVQVNGGEVEYVNIDDGGEYDDESTALIKLDKHLFNELAMAMTESLSKQGLKTKNESYMDGKIEAMKDNLLDLRQFCSQIMEIMKVK